MVSLMETLTLERVVSLEKMLDAAERADVFFRMGMLNSLLPDIILAAKLAREYLESGEAAKALSTPQ